MKFGAFMSGSSGTSSRVDIECVDRFSTFASAFAKRSDVGLLSCSEPSLANGSEAAKDHLSKPSTSSSEG